jgi:penicillin amidase
MRMVVDLGNLDGSLNNVTLGQSGQVFTPHYRDQFEHWLNTRSYPMLFSREKIDEQTESTLWLDPRPSVSSFTGE